MPDPKPQAPLLLLYRRLGRPPKSGELFLNGEHDVIPRGTSWPDQRYADVEALAPLDADAALERLLAWFRNDYNPYDADDVAKPELLNALAGPDPDEPPEWCVRCAEKWVSEKDTDFTRDLARHIARHAKRRETP